MNPAPAVGGPGRQQALVITKPGHDPVRAGALPVGTATHWAAAGQEAS